MQQSFINKSIRHFVITILFLFFVISTRAQAPTVQDCLGAIPICQNTYSTTNSYFGMGNYPNEIPWSGCLNLGGETNSVWYTFTVQTSGLFNFILTPNFLGDDYDWAVFNLTNASCSDLNSQFLSYLVSCNSSGNTGATGISSAMGGSGNSNGPGAGTNLYNGSLPVQAGETYVLMVSNWSSGAPGYNINFSTSTASIYDNTPPQIDQITSNISCGTTSITFEFSENIQCTTIGACDISLTGPGGPYTVSSVSGANCVIGGNQEKTFTVNFSPAITAGGNYSLNLTNTCSSVTDLCGNTAPPGGLPFTVNLPVPDAGVPQSVCPGASVILTATATGCTGGCNFAWNNGVVNGVPFVPAANTTYTVTATDASGCTATDAVTVTLYTPPVADAGSDKTVCPNVSVTLSGSGCTTCTYTWDNGVSNGIPFVPAAATTYTVTATDANGCTGTDAVLVTVSNVMTPDAGLDQTVCSGESVILSASADPGSTFTWSNNVTNNVPFTPASTVIYTVTATTGGCTGTDEVTVTVNPLPTAGAGIPQTVCPGASVTLSGSGGVSFIWDNNVTNGVPFIPPSTTTYTVTATDIYGCTDDAQVVITVMPPITIGFNTTDEHCGYADGSVTANPAGGAGNFTYLWSNSQGTKTASNLSAGNYTVTVTSNGCTESASASIINIPGPALNISSFVNETCSQSNGSAVVTATGGSGNYSYEWNSLPPQFSSFMQNVPAGTYTVTVLDGTCSATTSVIITNTPVPSLQMFSTPATCGLPNGTASVTALGGSGNYSYLWNTTNTDYNITGLNPGTYTVTVTDMPCTVSASTVVTDIPGPVADFSIHPKILTIMDGPVSFIDHSIGGIINWQWDFGDGTPYGSGVTTDHQYEDLGNYTVTLTVTDNNGCTDSVEDTLRIKEIYTFYIPNAFTPNGNSINDDWCPKFVGVNMRNYLCSVFDRWGNLVFSTANPYVAWNGTKNNNGTEDDVVPGVYVYRIRLGEAEGTRHEYIGSITLVY